MKVYVSESDDFSNDLLGDIEVGSYDEVEDVLILPGGLGCIYDLLRAIHDEKNIYLYNKDFYYTSFIKALYELHERKVEERVPSDYMVIESDFLEIKKKLEEKKNEEFNNGEASKLL